jgi:hypothetical protein
MYVSLIFLFFFPELIICFTSVTVNSLGDMLQQSVIPVISAMRRSTALSQKLVFNIFPPGHPKEDLVITFAKVKEMDEVFHDFVTK